MSAQPSVCDFYRQSHMVGRSIISGMEAAMGGGFTAEISAGPPVVMGDDTAANWLFANYAYATDVRPGRPPGIGEISATIENGRDGRLVIPYGNFDDIQCVFDGMRKTENLYRQEFADPLLRKILKGELPESVEPGIPCSDAVRRFLESFRRRYPGYPEDGVRADFPILKHGVWLIRRPSYMDAPMHLSGDGSLRRISFHTHPLGCEWINAIPSAADFRSLFTGNLPSGLSAVDPHGRVGVDESEYYVMHVSTAPLWRMQGMIDASGFPADTAGDPAARVEALCGSMGSVYEIVERGILGMRFNWTPKNGKLEVSPVISGAHYDVSGDGIPEGVPMGLSGCYLSRGKDRIPLDHVSYG